MPAQLDRCVQKVMGQGKSKSQAFAICQKALNMTSESNVEKAIKEHKLDEDGDIIIAENVPITITAGITPITE